MLVTSIVALVLVAVATGFAIPRLIARGIGYHLHDSLADKHATKTGKPTMGGAILVIGGLIAYVAGHVVTGTAFSTRGLLAVGAILGAGFVGFLDDFTKVRNERNLGLAERQKTIGMLVVGFGWAIATVLLTDTCTTAALTRCSNVPVDPGPIVWVLFAFGVIWLTGNSVNFADGLDGLLAGSAAITFSVLAAIAFWQFRHPGTYGVEGALDLALLAVAIAAACAGFLWWNAPPLQIGMGDTGSLALGVGIAVLMMGMDVTFLLPILGGLYVAEGASSWMQRWYFRLTGGKRLFRMAPIHHHFEQLDWAEPTILVRFWIVNLLFAVTAAAIFYGDWLHFAPR